MHRLVSFLTSSALILVSACGSSTVRQQADQIDAVSLYQSFPSSLSQRETQLAAMRAMSVADYLRLLRRVGTATPVTYNNVVLPGAVTALTGSSGASASLPEQLEHVSLGEVFPSIDTKALASFDEQAFLAAATPAPSKALGLSDLGRAASTVYQASNDRTCASRHAFFSNPPYNVNPDSVADQLTIASVLNPGADQAKLAAIIANKLGGRYGMAWFVGYLSGPCYAAVKPTVSIYLPPESD